jgi:hypothetical protein
MLHWSREGSGGDELVLTMEGICFLRLFRTYVGMCIGILVSEMGAVHLACRLAWSRRPYDAGNVVGKVTVHLQGYCVKTVGSMCLAFEKKEINKSLTRGHVNDIGSAVGMQSYRGMGMKGLLPGSAFVTSRYLHLYVMVVLSGARVVRALRVCVAAPC